MDPHLFAQTAEEEHPVFETRVIKVDPLHFEDKELEEAVRLLKAGEVVAFPTETVYGLGANALDGQACKKIFAAKRRPGDNPLITHISSMEMLSLLVEEVPPKVAKLLEESQFWPGPLTILFPKGDKVPNEVSAGQPTVGVRMPNHPVARKLIELAGVPIAAPSANSSGRPSPTTANHVYTDLKGRIPCIVDGGDAMVGVESTVLDMRADPPVILRPGGITQEQLARYLPDVKVYGKEGIARDAALEAAPPTPGLKYRHYSPTARVVLLEWTVKDVVGELVKRINECHAEKQKVGLIRTTGHGKDLPFTMTAFEGEKQVEEEKEGQVEVLVYSLGEEEQGDSERFAAAVANGLFKALRALDGSGVDVIFVEGISETHAGLAVMNRLRKAASEVVS